MMQLVRDEHELIADMVRSTTHGAGQRRLDSNLMAAAERRLVDRTA